MKACGALSRPWAIVSRYLSFPLPTSPPTNMVDTTDSTKTRIQLPDEQNGLLMVFRPFERLSYGLILEIKTGVKIGDRLTTPH